LKKGGLTVLKSNGMEWLRPDILVKLDDREYGA
jgi:hypothetical protein